MKPSSVFKEHPISTPPGLLGRAERYPSNLTTLGIAVWYVQSKRGEDEAKQKGESSPVAGFWLLGDPSPSNIRGGVHQFLPQDGCKIGKIESRNGWLGVAEMLWGESLRWFNYWLVVKGCHEFYFPINIGLLIIPMDFHIFSEGWPWPTNQLKWFN